jgi:hypothetical protein
VCRVLGGAGNRSRRSLGGEKKGETVKDTVNGEWGKIRGKYRVKSQNMHMQMERKTWVKSKSTKG